VGSRREHCGEGRFFGGGGAFVAGVPIGGSACGTLFRPAWCVRQEGASLCASGRCWPGGGELGGVLARGGPGAWRCR